MTPHVAAAVAAAALARDERHLRRIQALEAEVVALTAQLAEARAEAALARRCASRLDGRNAELRRERDRLEKEAAPGAGAPVWLPEQATSDQPTVEGEQQ